MPNALPGQSITKLFSVKNTSEEKVSYTIYFDEMINEFLNDELVYKLYRDDELVVDSTPISETLLEGIEINAGVKHEYKLEITFIETGSNQNYNLRKAFSGIINIIESLGSDFTLAVYVDGEKRDTFPTRDSGYFLDKLECSDSGVARWDFEKWKLNALEIGGPTHCDVHFKESIGLKEILLSSNTLREETPNFAIISTNSDTGMYSMVDDDGISYYFRGTKTLLNNNVIFGGFQWKIIRINGDGSIRMIYNGTCPNNPCTLNTTGASTQIGTSAFNISQNNAKYVGYTYDTNTSSTIKGVVETWYQNNLGSFDTYIADTVYCNDRSGAGTTNIFHGAHTRLYANKSPSLKCPNSADKYTKSSAKGNKLLSQKAGLIMADEVALAGTVFYGESNKTYYLYTEQDYWTISPYGWSGGTTEVFNANSIGYIAYYSSAQLGVRPVISLNPNIQISSGDGSTVSPYIIKN